MGDDLGEPSTAEPTPVTATTRRRWPRRAAIAGAALLALLILITFTGTPTPIRRHSAADLIAFRDRIDAACHNTFGPARIDWIEARVDFPSGLPSPLTQDEQQMTGTGPKIGCVEHAIS